MQMSKLLTKVGSINTCLKVFLPMIRSFSILSAK